MQHESRLEAPPEDRREQQRQHERADERNQRRSVRGHASSQAGGEDRRQDGFGEQAVEKRTPPEESLPMKS